MPDAKPSPYSPFANYEPDPVNTLNLILSGMSMATTIPPGSTVVHDKSVGYDQIKKGDYVTYYHERLGDNVTHKVFKKMDGGWWAKGECQLPDDTYITPKNFVGIASKIIPPQKNDKK